MVGGSNGDGYTCDVAKFVPQHLTFDSNGNLLLADTWDHRIRKIDGNDIASTIAGIGVSGFNGDGILAVQAKLSSPTGIAVASDGDIFFSDQMNHRVRRVDKQTGLITTAAGTGATLFNGDGPGVTSNLSYPAGIFVSSLGLLITDSGNQRIRLLDSQGYLRTVAGTGGMGWFGDGGAATAAKVSNPSHAIADHSGNIYIADRGNCRVRRIDANGIITTFAGMAEAVAIPCGRTGDGGPATSAKLSGPSTLALDPQEQYLYIVDSSSLVVRRVNLSTGVISHVAGTGFPGSGGDGGLATLAQLTQPSGLAFNGLGELFIADANLRRIRRIDRDGIIETIAGGSGGDGLPSNVTRVSPKGLAFDLWGNLHIADSEGNQSRIIDTRDTADTLAGSGDYGFSGDGGIATSAKLAWPVGIASDSNGRTCFSDQLNHRVRCVNASTHVITTLAGTGQAMWNGEGSASAASLNYPAGLLADIDNSILIADSSNHRIRRVKDGTITTIVGTGNFWFNADGLAPLATNINNPTAIALDPQRNLYIAEKSSCRIRKYDVSAGVMVTIAGTGTCGSTGDGGQATAAKVAGPEYLAISSDNILYFSESPAPRVRQVDLNTGIISRVAGTGVAASAGDGGPATSAQLMRPTGLLLDPSEAYLYIGDFDAGNIRRVTLDGGVGAGQPSPTPTGTPTPLPPTSTPEPPTATSTKVPTATVTRTETPLPTFTAIFTATHTAIFTATRTPTHTPTFTRTGTATRTRTRTATLTRTPTKQATALPTRTNTRLATATRTRTPVIAATATRTRTATTTRTFTRTAVGASTPTPTAGQFVTTPTGPIKTATRTATKVNTALPTKTATKLNTAIPTKTLTKVSTAIATKTVTKVSTATLTRTATRTRTATKASTATRTRTATITRTPTRTLTGTKTSIVPTSTPTLVPTNTPTLTPTPTVDPLRSDANVGPRITYVGLATTGNVVLQPNGYENGVPIFQRTTGSGFYIVAEAKKGSAGITIGRQVQRGGTAMADFQVEVSQNVGDGSATFCDVSSGGAQAISPLDFEPSPFVINATSDFTCGFTSTISSSSTVTYAAGQIRSFVAPDSTVQFSYLVPTARAFLSSDTLFTVRVLDINGNPGPIEQMIVRIG